MRIFILGSFVQACCWTVTRLPKAGETFEASAVNIEAGGKGLNVALCAARLGAKVDIALGVGEDNAAAAVIALLEKEHVTTQYVYALSKQSGYGAGLIASHGQNAIAVYPGPNLLLNADHIKQAESAIKMANVVYGQFETSLIAIEEAFLLAKKHHILTILNPSPYKVIPLNILNYTDIIIVNEVEICDFLNLAKINFNTKIVDLIKKLKTQADIFFTRWHGKHLIVTLGEFGSVAFTPKLKAQYCPAYNIQAIDTIGAGDAFASGFCVAYAKKENLLNMLKYGNACGAIVASKLGVLNILPNANTVAIFMQINEFKPPI